jgi:hypothetical protein
MEIDIQVKDLKSAFALRSHPTVTSWNRLEGRPRTANFERALRAEVRDALWMLTRQWQMGEFTADDAGTPVFTRLLLETSRLGKYQAAQHPPEAFNERIPLEAQVEQRSISFEREGLEISLDLRIQMGRQWLRLLTSLSLLSPAVPYRQQYITVYGFQRPDPTQAKDAAICAHPEVWALQAAVAGRCMDGFKLYRFLKEAPNHQAGDQIQIADGHQQPLGDLGRRFVAWFERLYLQPQIQATEQVPREAWLADRLEYQFACSAPSETGELVLVAEQYHQSHLDWYNVDLDTHRPRLGSVVAAPENNTTLQNLIPTQVAFEGVPNTRWWSFEDRRTNFGDVQPATTDLAKLLVLEFALVYGNDWFLIPVQLPMGSIAQMKALITTNVFGESYWIAPAIQTDPNNPTEWSMFTLSNQHHLGQVTDPSLLLLPVVPKLQQGPPQEEIALIRDELANMVWGIEKTVALPSGISRPGAEVSRDTFEFAQSAMPRKLQQLRDRKAELELVSEANRSDQQKQELQHLTHVLDQRIMPETKANLRYQIMNSVPEHWIPFVPVHVAGDLREIQLQRSAMPRAFEGAIGIEKVRPRTSLLRTGLDQTTPEPYFLHEEEVPRSGIVVQQAFKRTRWHNGQVVTWLGVHKQVGRGEGSSKLAFDQIVDVKK